MGNKNSFEGGFAGDTGETQAPEYRTVRRPKFSSNPGRESDIYKDRKEEYIRDIEKKYGLTGNRWKFLIGKYFDFNRDLIDPNQEDLDGKVLEEIFNEYGAKNSLDINSRLDSMLSSKQEKVVITEKLESPQVVEDSGVKKTGLQSIELSPEQQAEIEARKANYQYPTRIAKDGDYVRGMTLPEWLQIEEGSSEHTTLIKGIKTNGIMPSLGKLGSNIKDQKANNDISGEYLAFINATREFYGLAPYVSEPEELVLENPTVNQLEFDLDGQQEPTPVVETESGTTPPVEDVRSTGEEVAPTQEISEVQATDSENGYEALPGPDKLLDALNVLVEEITTQESNSVGENSNTLQQELDRLIVETDQRLSKESKPNKEKLERFKDNAIQAISNFQQFVRDHSSPADKANSNVQEQCRQYENTAWDELYRLAHLLDGEIAVLPQDRDIQVSHPEGVDTKEYLEQIGYKFDEKGDIVEIMDKGVNIRLNRARTIQNLINSKRPSHILYNKSFTLDDNDIYQGYIIEGLNLNTPDWFELVLRDNKFLEPVIVDETGQSTVPTTEAKQDPWSSESSGETEFEKIFADSLSRNENAQGNNEIPDPWVEEAKVTDPETPEQTEGGENLPIDNPDRGSLYCQEIQLWNNIQALENRQKENPKDELVKVELHKAKQAYKEFRTDISTSPEQDKFQKFLELRELYAQAESENTRGRIQKLFRLKKNNSSELENIRSQYNEALEALLKTETIIGVEGKIKEMFSDEVQRLSGERVVQTKELQEKNQSGLDRALNPLKDRIFNWYIKNKSAVGVVNLGLFATSTLLAFTGAGIPLAGAVNTLRHAIAYPMAAASGISGRELIRSKFEDENTNLNLDIKKFNLKTNFEFLKFKGGITKLVDKSLQDKYIQNASDEDLSKLVSTLESYYGLNGGKFTDLNQQKAYEMGLNELGSRLERTNNQSTDEQDISSESNVVDGLDYKFDFKNTKEFKIKTVDGLVTRISQDRISALNDQKNKRLVANVAGTALGSSLLFNLVAQDLQLNKPNLGDSVSTTGESRPKPPTGDPTPEVKAPGTEPTASGTTGAPEAGTGSIKPLNTPSTPTPGEGGYPPAPDLPSPEEALRMRQAAATANEAREVLAQDVSSLDSGETIWSQASKWLGPDASQGQIQEAVEKYLGSIKGQDTIFKLANQTEGGRELLSQWGVDTAGEMAGLSKEQLYEVSKYLGEGKLDGLTELSLDNLDALEQAEYVAPSPTEVPTIEPGSTETPAPPAGTEDIGSKPPAPSSPPVTEAPVAPPSTLEAPPVATSEFTKDLSEILGKQNLTDIQAREIVQSYFADDYGREAIYNSIINTGEGATVLSNGFGVNTLADFANLTPDQMYEITNSIDSNELRKILNQTILARFEDAPDMVELTRGTNSLNVVQRYIANELGSLPYDSNLGKQVLDTYVQTDAGKMWIYDAIVNNPDVNNQNIQYFKEYLRFKDIKSSEEFVSKFNWAEFSGNRNIPTSGFWNQIRLPNGGTKLQPLSTFLQPSKMIGIKDAVRQVLTRQ